VGGVGFFNSREESGTPKSVFWKHERQDPSVFSTRPRTAAGEGKKTGRVKKKIAFSVNSGGEWRRGRHAIRSSLLERSIRRGGEARGWGGEKG